MTGPLVDWDKLGRYLAGESSPDEAAAVRHWLEAHPSDAKFVAALEAAVGKVAPASPVDVEAALRRVKTRMHAASPSPWRRYAVFAAAAAVILVAGVLVTRQTTPERRVVAARTYTTQVGERRDVLLADGTQVTLGPATSLVVLGRDAELSGEALFSVVHDRKRPFTVRAGDAVIRDIGTEFTVHSDPGEAVRVVVNEGVVQLSHGGDSVMLARGDVGVLETNGRVAASPGAATDDDLAWTRGRLVFRNADVTELAADLRRWYGVELRVTDTALLRRHFTGSFAREPANRVLDVIALALGAHVERRGDTAFILP
ncbi:MAG TPA: FecR domain-containing protein, partial [Gemmatimonadaceae bacterium]